MPDNPDVFTPPPPQGSWPRFRVWLRGRRRRVAVASAVVVVLVVTLIVLWPRPEDPCGAGSGLWSADGQCVGVTEGGGHPFHASFADIERKIAAENAAVRDSGHTVTVALADPLTVDATSAVTLEQVRYELEGAYTAQYRINHTGAVGDRRPLVRLVLANWGSHEQQWRPVVERLESMVDDPAPLVAVAGLRLSTVETQRAAQHLAQHNVPTVSAIATADQLNYGDIRGFVRASPPNVEYVAALRGYLRHHPELNTAMLVYDNNSDANPASGTEAGSDLFTRSLREDFRTGLAFAKQYPPQGFTGKSGHSQASPDLFTAITTNICAVRPKVVPYAGRVGDFGGFLDSLRSRPCPDVPVTVFAAGADFGLLGLRSRQADLREANLRVVYATETDPEGWVGRAPGTPRFFGEFYAEYRRLGFAAAHLSDGAAISTHDALLIATKAARLFTRARSDHASPTHSDVLNQMLNLNTLDAVPGASGQLSFSYRGADSGNPSHKPVPVIEVPSAAVAQTAEVYYTK